MTKNAYKHANKCMKKKRIPKRIEMYDKKHIKMYEKTRIQRYGKKTQTNTRTNLWKKKSY